MSEGYFSVVSDDYYLRGFPELEIPEEPLSAAQNGIFKELQDLSPDANLSEVDTMMRLKFKVDGSIQWETMELIVRMFRPFVVQPGIEKKIVFYKNGKWFHDGEGEIRRIVISLLGEDGTHNHANRLIKRMQVTLPCYSVGSAVFDSSDMPYENENNNEEDFDDHLPF